ncbi:hypothetical protein HTZ97_13685 [Desulfuromonas acetoxidans]|uniref:hypothetical protein n=1 Tax=Desulfuromonas acetoxidans TaxID=891 RepID=UPI0015934DDE|nr:hypothetical protein [Desulfuromonas acetoxidans]MBF0644878.1 hypothetical protein [Desulfuromonas acetoxidans]NVD25395.1 hypothetical protein [Desulfuromonas acetoxidans]NVE17504.1 hypothetical protein [Desulfuromonas acetoxidans]
MDFSLESLINGIKQAFYDGLDWLVQQLVFFLDFLFNLVVDLFNFLILVIATGIDLVVSLLPVDTDCAELLMTAPDVSTYLMNDAVNPSSMINFINWVLPVDVMACVIGAVCTSYVLYFTVGRVLKFLQVL